MAVLTRGIPTNTVINGQAASQNIGGSVVTVLPANGQRQYLRLQNLHATQTIGFTLDGSTPAIGTAGTFTLQAGTVAGSVAEWTVFVPVGAIMVIASGSGTPLTVNEA